MNSFIAAAFDEAEAAARMGEAPIGAVVVKNGVILARAGNRVETLNDPTAHAEILAIRSAAAQNGGRLDDCDLYVTLEPCPMCAGAIALARLRRVYFSAYDPKRGGVEHGPRIFDHPTCHHRPEIVGGIEEQRASSMLKAFFEKLR